MWHDSHVSSYFKVVETKVWHSLASITDDREGERVKRTQSFMNISWGWNISRLVHVACPKSAYGLSWHSTEALKDDWRGPDGKSRQCTRGGNWKVSTEIVTPKRKCGSILARDRKSILPDTQSGVWRTLNVRWTISGQDVAFQARSRQRGHFCEMR